MKKEAYNEEDDEHVISEGSEYSPKSEFSKPRLVEEAVKKCLAERAKEMREGYYTYKFDQNGIPLRTWIPDQREIFNSTIAALKTLLSPEIQQNENYRKVQKKVEDRIEQLFEKYCYSELEPTIIDNNKMAYKETGFKYIPKKGERVLIKQLMPNGRTIAKELVGGWDRKIDFYLDELVKLNDELFAAINELIDSMNYFKSGMNF